MRCGEVREVRFLRAEILICGLDRLIEIIVVAVLREGIIRLPRAVERAFNLNRKRRWCALNEQILPVDIRRQGVEVAQAKAVFFMLLAAGRPALLAAVKYEKNAVYAVLTKRAHKRIDRRAKKVFFAALRHP